MCRLAYIPKAFDGMSDWLYQMERSCGGHGTGVAMGNQMFKGISTTARDAAREISLMHMAAVKRKKRRLPALWHSRLTSSGGHHDDLCHPFACAGGWLVHNGHWHEFADKARQINNMPMSDTRLFSFIVNKNGFLKSIKAQQPPGVWLHMLHDGRLAVSKRGGSLCYNPRLGVWGSEPPIDEDGWFNVADDVYDYGDEPVLTGKVKSSSCEQYRTRTYRMTRYAMSDE